MEAAAIDPRAFHRGLVVIDGHCDTALDLAGISFREAGSPARDFLVNAGRGHVDLPRLEAGGQTCQVFALFTDDAHVAEAEAHTWRLLEGVEREWARSDRFRPARRAADIEAAKAGGWVSGMLSIEGGECVGESLDALRAFHARGVRLMGLTWNRRNAIARGVGAPGPGGLTPFGRSVVAEMERLGMVVDVSHLSDEALDEVLEIAQRPLVASHSNAKALCDHRRNLTDAQVERIAATGGLVGLCFAGVFVDAEPAKVGFGRAMEHLERLIAVAGAEHVGLGSDFDGFTDPYGRVFGGCDELPRVTEHLLGAGHSPAEVAAVMGGNWLRVIREVCG